jgi:hypothetical protein
MWLGSIAPTNRMPILGLFGAVYAAQDDRDNQANFFAQKRPAKHLTAPLR